MFKKLVLMLLALVIAVPLYAGQVEKEIIDSTLSITTPALEADWNCTSSERVAFFVTLANNRTTAAVTATVTVAASVDGVNWQDINWFDVAGGVTPQTTESTTDVNQTYIGWLDNKLPMKYIRIRVNATELGLNYGSRFVATDNATISVTIVEEK